MQLTDWEESLLQQKIKNEINTLSEWWHQRKQDHKNHIENKQQQEEDTQMLIKLIQIRGYLWS